MSRWIVFSIFIFCVTFTLVGVVLDVIFQVYYQPAMDSWQKVQGQKLAHYIQEKDYFSDHALFSHKSDAALDFANFLSSRITTDKNFIFISPDQQKVTLSLGDKWVQQRNVKKLSKPLKVTFTRIKEFGIWSVNDTIKLNPNITPVEFIVASQIYLTHILHKQSPLTELALEQVRHLALLLINSQNFNYKLAGLSIMEKEKTFLDFIERNHPRLKIKWQTISQEDQDRFRKFLYTTYEYLDFLTKKKILDKVFITGKLPTGFCAVFGKKWPIIHESRPYLASKFPFEPDFSINDKTLGSIYNKAQQVCQKNHQKFNDKQPFRSIVPYYRRIHGIKYLLSNKSLGN